MIDKTAFVAQIDAKSTMLYRIARTILTNDEDCKDALQETVLRAWASRHKLRDEALFGTWITRILINECHTLGRKKQKYVLPGDMPDTQSTPPPDPALQLALEGLPEKLRLPLVLHYLEGYGYDQVAAILHVPQSTVRNRLARARSTLRMQMQDEKEAWLHEAQ